MENSGLTSALQLAQQGSAHALGELLEGCRQYLLLVANEELEPDLVPKGGASDVVQETFMRAQRYFFRFRGSTEAELLAWLRHILRNQLVALRRRYLIAEKRCVDREISLDGNRRHDIAKELTARTGSPSRHAMDRERAQALESAISRLPERDRRVIQLRHRDQLPFDEVACRLELTPTATRQLWVRAIRRLQRKVAREIPRK